MAHLGVGPWVMPSPLAPGAHPRVYCRWYGMHKQKIVTYKIAINVIIMMPRLTARQRDRTNVPADSAHAYYRRAVFLPFVNFCIAQMKERFSRQALVACQLSALLLPEH